MRGRARPGDLRGHDEHRRKRRRHGERRWKRRHHERGRRRHDERGRQRRHRQHRRQRRHHQHKHHHHHDPPPECEPATTEPCYGGPPLTEGIGACKAGERTCDAAGLWSACAGEVTPQIEACSTLDVDESCDNLAKCAGAFRWAKRFGGALDQAPGLPAAGADGTLHLTGAATGALDFGGGALFDGGGKDIFLARLDRDGKHLWSKRLGGPGDQSGVAVAVDPSGNVVVVGTVAGTMVDAGGGVLPVAGATDLVIAKYAPDGAHLWSKQFGDTDSQSAGALAVDGAGDVLVAGAADTAAGTELLLAKLSASDGATVWSETFPVGDAQTAAVTGLATAANGEVVLVGFGKGAPEFGGPALPKPTANDVFAARFDSLWRAPLEPRLRRRRRRLRVRRGPRCRRQRRLHRPHPGPLRSSAPSPRGHRRQARSTSPCGA